ncbi:MAG: DNA-3-methyladenine glycosylase [Actinobacteria bacterium]|nr:DNA-3-methyladenine glycosylase [Actinomycetota bacterium]
MADRRPVERSFLERDPVEVAPSLLGCVLARTDGSGRVRSGRIVEVEAYRGEADPASHAYRGPTPRTRVMFGPPGHLYVYRSYGIHWCCNVVCGADGTAAAVLIRALEPVEGIDAMFRSRPRARRDRDLASGPGKLCAALGITGSDGGADLCGATPSAVTLFAGAPSGGSVLQGPRIGVSAGAEEPWRFWLAGNRHVSARRTVPGSAP